MSNFLYTGACIACKFSGKSGTVQVAWTLFVRLLLTKFVYNLALALVLLLAFSRPLVSSLVGRSLHLGIKSTSKELVQELVSTVVVDAVVAVGEWQDFELRRGDCIPNKQVNQSCRVLIVHVVVASTVHNRNSTGSVMEAGGVADSRSVVTLHVVFVLFHVALCPHGGVEPEVGNGRSDETECEGA